MNSKKTFIIIEYRFIKKLGEGTFSEVFRAQSLKTGRDVAIKCLKGTFNNRDKVNEMKEIQALNKLSSHPNIISLIETI